MDFYNEIKNVLINNESYKKIKDYSKSLTNELGKDYTQTNLRYLKQFYLFEEKYHAVRDDLSWTIYREIMKLNDIN